MKQTGRKLYATPSLLELGALKDITEETDQPNSDSEGGQDGTAFKPGS